MSPWSTRSPFDNALSRWYSGAMLHWRQLHRDSGIYAWDQDYKSPASVTARRLFKNLSEMRAVS